MSQLDFFDNTFSEKHFESYSHENGFVYWYATDLMSLLGYNTLQSFEKAINKAMTTCNTLNIHILDNFEQVHRDVNGKTIKDYKLSRFACYLSVMGADGKMPAVAGAQAYFATLAGAVQHYLQEVENVDRIVIRDEVSEREKSLSSVVHQAGVENYAFFQNAGYRGMYNKNLGQLKTIRKIDSKRSLLDFMGKEELAANLFRITQTELKIKNEGTSGQSKLEDAAYIVGQKVRKTMIEISNIKPEELSKNSDIKEVKSQLKKNSKKFQSIDKKKK